MFQSIRYKYSDDINSKSVYEIVDSEFGSCITAINYANSTFIFAIIQEYTKRNLEIIENLASFNFWYIKAYSYSFEKIKQYYELYCPEHIKNNSNILNQVYKLTQKYLLLE